VLKNADCLGQDLDPAKEYYAQKDIPNVRRMVLLELIRLKIISGTAAATLPASIDPKGDGDPEAINPEAIHPEAINDEDPEAIKDEYEDYAKDVTHGKARPDPNPNKILTLTL